MAKDLKESGSAGSRGRMKRIVERYNTTDDSGKTTKTKIVKKQGKNNTTKVKFKRKTKKSGIINTVSKTKGSATYKDIKPSEMKTGTNYRDKRDKDSVKSKSSVKSKVGKKTISSSKYKDGKETKASIAKNKRNINRNKKQQARVEKKMNKK